VARSAACDRSGGRSVRLTFLEDDEDIDEIAQYTYSIRILTAEVFHAEEIDDLY